MKNMFTLLVAGVVMLLAAESASAQFPNANPFNSPTGDPLFKRLFVKQPLPAFQAAPWYLYWPYHAHFMTPAPLGLGAPYASPPVGQGYGFGGGNPYFPQSPNGMPRYK
jgi:hypothetical protein